MSHEKNCKEPEDAFKSERPAEDAESVKENPDEETGVKGSCSVEARREEYRTGAGSKSEPHLSVEEESKTVPPNLPWSTSSDSCAFRRTESLFSNQCVTCAAVKNDFVCEENKEFWDDIADQNCHLKIFKSIRDYLLYLYPEYKGNRTVFTILKELLNVKDDDSEVKVTDFIKVVKAFGPIRKENFCVLLEQLQILQRNCCPIVNKQQACWFAGDMKRDEAEKHLQDKEKNTFLVRMSSNVSWDGSFALSISLGDGNVDHFCIKGRPSEAVTTAPFSAQLTLEGEDDGPKYKNLPDMMKNRLRKRNITSGNFGGAILKCLKPCTGLPFNQTMLGYSKVSKRE